MKKLFLSILTAVSLVTLVHGQTNSTPTTNSNSTNTVTALTETVKSVATQTVTTNLNSIMIEMLSGVKDVGKEIYGASKEAIHTSVNFVEKQAPEVITQFIHWKIAEAIVWMIIWGSVGGLILFFAHKLHKYSLTTNDTDEIYTALAFKWILSFVAALVIFFGVGSWSFDVVKLAVAPKVYIIEYVVDLIKHNR